MGESLQDTDLEFFNSPLPDESSVSGHSLEDSSPASSPTSRGLHPDLSSTPSLRSRQHQVVSHPLSETGGSSQTRSIQSSVSPETSSQDSSSESSRRHKRKTSSNSSRSVVAVADAIMTDEEDASLWKSPDLVVSGDDPSLSLDNAGFPSLGGLSDPLSMEPDYEFSNKAMENHFDFDSAASSPSPFDGGVPFGSISIGSAKTIDVSYQASRRPGNKLEYGGRMHPRSPAHTSEFFVQGSREASPLSAMVTSQESSPSAFLNNHSPSSSSSGDFVSGPTLGGNSQNLTWPTTYDFSTHGLPSALPACGLTPSPILNDIDSPYSAIPSKPANNLPPRLTVHPTPLKSRVETQIPIKMTLFPIPPGVTKLHLPTHTISKPKLLSKPGVVKSPDTLELHTMLVCTSAMQDPVKLHRAFARAAGADSRPKRETARRLSSGDVPADDDDENKPINGGEVVICPGCITRERKRAARKKMKKVDEEESWLKDEHKRVIVFNTHELKEWQSPTTDSSAELNGDGPPPPVPDGAMQVDAPMRIACYCRHQNEKLGFQVIFTIKDYEDRLVAQAITTSIMITDDHKTHAPPSASSSHSPNNSGIAQLPGVGSFVAAHGFNMPSGLTFGNAPFRLSHSTTDLQGLQRNFNPHFAQQPPNSFSPPPIVSQSTSATLTPRNMSRQASPSGPSGPSSKKRKASGPSKVPTGLAMTKLETSDVHSAPRFPMGGPNNITTTAAASSYTPNFVSAMPQPDRPYAAPSTSIPPQFSTGPPTPNSNDLGFFTPAQRSQSMENLPLQQMFSTPNSTHPSRAPSPHSASRINANALQQSQAQVAQAVANSLYGVPLALNPHRPPTIHKLIPSEGPRAGGIEVTCLGNGFCQGLEVMFGDSQATTTTYWGDASLVCLLPPAAHAGSVPVTFKHQRVQQMHMQQYPSGLVPKQQIQFKYLDDDEQQLLKLALNIVGHKMTGRMEDAGDIARRIVTSGPNTWAASPTQGNNQHRQASAFDATMLGPMDLEATLLACLDLIDLDDSPFPPRLNLRRPTGHSLLHFAASLGLHRFVAGLLARGANPDVRDKGGYGPMHYASLHDHPQIVRRLRLAGGDPTIRSLRGFTPADLATSLEVLESTRSVEYHSRSRSAGASSPKSRESSATSLRSLWEPPSPTSQMKQQPDGSILNSSDDDSERGDGVESDDDYELEAASPAEYWSQSRRNSHMSMQPAFSPQMVETNPGFLSPTAAMTAWRDQLSAQIQHFQQNVHWTLPNLQIPALPPMPNLPHYQAYPMVRRISSLVPHRGGSRTPGDLHDGTKEGEYGWWELLTGSSSSPPAYEEIYPPKAPSSVTETKTASAVRAQAETSLDQKCTDAFHEVEGSTSSIAMPTDVRIGRGLLPHEQQDQVRAAHAKKIKRIQSDRNLFFIWIPLLVIVVVAMLKNRVPQVWNIAMDGISYLKNRNGERIIELL
ncbi:MAG: hypothetical protein M1830_004356 [Pleopsidium flavum]|nr:MAG: hypothetical protein M1830_004356 [Pleopsidium flavum]